MVIRSSGDRPPKGAESKEQVCQAQSLFDKMKRVTGIWTRSRQKFLLDCRRPIAGARGSVEVKKEAGGLRYHHSAEKLWQPRP